MSLIVDSDVSYSGFATTSDEERFCAAVQNALRAVAEVDPGDACRRLGVLPSGLQVLCARRLSAHEAFRLAETLGIAFPTIDRRYRAHLPPLLATALGAALAQAVVLGDPFTAFAGSGIGGCLWFLIFCAPRAARGLRRAAR